MAKLTLLLFINIAASQAFRSISFCISLHFDNAVNVKEKKSFWLSQLKFHQLQLPGLPYDWHWVFLVSWTSVSIFNNLDRLFKKYPELFPWTVCLNSITRPPIPFLANNTPADWATGQPVVVNMIMLMRLKCDTQRHNHHLQNNNKTACFEKGVLYRDAPPTKLIKPNTSGFDLT